MLILGCGGSSPLHDSVRTVPIALAATDAGSMAFSGSAIVSETTNASLPMLALDDASRFDATAGEVDGDGQLSFHFVGPRGQVLRLSFYNEGEKLAAGQTFDLESASGTTLDYREDERGAYRTWSAEGGRLVIDSVTDEDVVAHVENAQMVPGDGQECLEGRDCIKDSAQGWFALNVDMQIARPRGQIALTPSEGSNYSPTTISPPSGSFSAYSTASEIDLSASEFASGSSVFLQCFPSSRPVAVGTVFNLDGRKNLGLLVGYGDDGSHLWKVASGTVTITAIHGRVITAQIANATFVPKERATGTVTANGTITVLVP